MKLYLSDGFLMGNSLRRECLCIVAKSEFSVRNSINVFASFQICVPRIRNNSNERIESNHLCRRRENDNELNGKKEILN